MRAEPGKMTYARFKESVEITKEEFCRHAFRENQDKMRIKKENTAIKSLEKIFDATFKICTRKGFQGMSMRDLSRESGLSMGALYSYFSSKEELLNSLQRVGNKFVKKILSHSCQQNSGAVANLRNFIQTHIYLSEAIQPWFYFSYMEVKNLNKRERNFYKKAELFTEKIVLDILHQGEEEGCFKPKNHKLAASVIKAMIQDWYLKRWKYAKRQITVDQYTEFIIEFIESYYLCQI